MKTILSLLLFFTSTLIAVGQDELTAIVLNKNQEVPVDWVERLQNAQEWVFQNKVIVKSRRIKDYYLSENGERWTFKPSTAIINPYHWKIDNQEYSSFDVTYHRTNNTLIIGSMLKRGNLTTHRKEVYEVINVTDEYLMLEKINETYCFDFTHGRRLSKRECLQ